MSELDRLVAEARDARPDPLAERDIRKMADRAAVTGGARHRSWTLRRVMLVAGAAAALMAAAVTLALLPRAPEDDAFGATRGEITHRTEGTEPTELELMTGDHLVATAGARFHVEAPGSNLRSVRLDSGAMLFDVRQIEGGRFSVATPNAEIVVLGTVFTVDATERGTTVRVYEGRVELRGPGRAREVSAGGVAHLGDGEPAPDALEARGVEAAQQRLALAADDPGAPPPEAVQETVQETVPEPLLAREETPAAFVAQPTPGEEQDEQAPVALAPPTFGEARTWIASGEPERALAHARSATAEGDVNPWRMLEGDALRALGRLEEAADIYHRAAGELTPPRRQQAGFLEARLRATDLSDPAGALRALRDADVTAPTSPLRERGLSLEAQILERLGQSAELDSLARVYLRDYPNGPRAAAMRAYLAE